MKYAAVIEYLQDKETVERPPGPPAYLTSLVEKTSCSPPGRSRTLRVRSSSTRPTRRGGGALMKADPFHARACSCVWTVRPWKMVFANPRLMPGV